jgi:hypothetical protein
MTAQTCTEMTTGSSLRLPGIPRCTSMHQHLWLHASRMLVHEIMAYGALCDSAHSV